ncbi:PilT/PilU family type 4a pilus ATPase [Iamia sp. SCSIO 61187]|uniref:type IV pilus twitching motility protein PilT n=1 Tax=Iamia sp. SCSIO 61187 TaxID=2722752 RepID=UPI001C62630D|nr:PilT/PilU family type 4a pilus ATPase [Iamia sp. SCSIO 61187]QYG95291.1 PilT/PilU family type 4a pilus ATPase [Iamia sp. SCSIO 61187]
MPDLAHLLHHLAERRGSDLIVKVGSPPHVRVDGHLQPTDMPTMGPAEIEQVLTELLPVAKAEELLEKGEVDVAHGVAGVGRFRVNVFRQRGSLSLAIRRVVPGAPAIADLNLPAAVEKLAMEDAGLIVVAGPAASGKTTTVAAILDHVNATRARHIVTIEDPIEVLLADKRSLVSQREVGSDATSISEALRRVGRQNADVIFVSDIPDAATAERVVSEALSGRLVVVTMAALTAAETISRLVDFYPPHLQRQARYSIAQVLRGVIAQRLLDRVDGRGRVPAVEVLIGTQKITEAIAGGADEATLEALMREGEYHGMQSFDQALLNLYRDSTISVRDAVAAASRPEDLRIAMQHAGMAAAY